MHIQGSKDAENFAARGLSWVKDGKEEEANTNQRDAHCSSVCIGGFLLVAFGVSQHTQQEVHTSIPRQGSGQRLHRKKGITCITLC